MDSILGVAVRKNVIEKAIGRGEVMMGGVRLVGRELADCGLIGPVLSHRRARTQLLVGSMSSLWAAGETGVERVVVDEGEKWGEGVGVRCRRGVLDGRG